jgi:hypothetical protein
MKLPQLAALPLCLILAACGGGQAKYGPVEPAMAAFISPDAVAVAGVRLDSIRETPLYRKLAGENRLPRFASNLDPKRDLHEILLASDGKNVLAIARGVIPAKPAGDLNAAEYKGFTLYGSSSSVQAAIDRSKSGGAGAPRDLMERARVLPADAQIWAVVSGWRGLAPDQLREMGNLSNLDRVLRLVEGANLTVDLRTGVHAAFTSDSRTDADAKTLADSLRGLAGLARMAATRNQPDLQRAFDGLQVKQDGRRVNVNVDLAEDLAEKLVR